MSDCFRPILTFLLLPLATGVATSVAAEKARWETVAEIPASEAVQAAAADGQFVYAIASRQIAKYDRQSGKRVAVSSGNVGIRR